MSVADWEEVFCIAVVVDCVIGLVWYLWHGGW